jgi:hypothetical protein
MRLEQHLKHCKWSQVRKLVVKTYRGDTCAFKDENRYIAAFKRAFYELKTKQAIPDSRIINLDEDELWAYYESKEMGYPIELMLVLWGNCLGMQVVIKGKKMSSAEVVWHCLWSITYSGWSEKQAIEKFKD